MFTKPTFALALVLATASGALAAAEQQSFDRRHDMYNARAAKEARAQHRANNHTNVRHLPAAFGRTYGYVPGKVPRYGLASDVYSSDSLGRQSFPNPDRDFSIENLRSHPSN
jgi:hypothetical protein